MADGGQTLGKAGVGVAFDAVQRVGNLPLQGVEEGLRLEVDEVHAALHGLARCASRSSRFNCRSRRRNRSKRLDSRQSAASWISQTMSARNSSQRQRPVKENL